MSTIDQIGKVRQLKTDLLTTESRRKPISNPILIFIHQ